jgi:hypothetical protein
VVSTGSGYGPVAGCCEHGDESSGPGTMELARCSSLVQTRCRFLMAFLGLQYAFLV